MDIARLPLGLTRAPDRSAELPQPPPCPGCGLTQTLDMGPWLGPEMRLAALAVADTQADQVFLPEPREIFSAQIFAAGKGCLETVH